MAEYQYVDLPPLFLIRHVWVINELIKLAEKQDYAHINFTLSTPLPELVEGSANIPDTVNMLTLKCTPKRMGRAYNSNDRIFRWIKFVIEPAYPKTKQLIDAWVEKYKDWSDEEFDWLPFDKSEAK